MYQIEGKCPSFHVLFSFVILYFDCSHVYSLMKVDIVFLLMFSYDLNITYHHLKHTLNISLLVMIEYCDYYYVKKRGCLLLYILLWQRDILTFMKSHHTFFNQ